MTEGSECRQAARKNELPDPNIHQALPREMPELAARLTRERKADHTQPRRALPCVRKQNKSLSPEVEGRLPREGVLLLRGGEGVPPGVSLLF